MMLTGKRAMLFIDAVQSGISEGSAMFLARQELQWQWDSDLNKAMCDVGHGVDPYNCVGVRIVEECIGGGGSNAS